MTRHIAFLATTAILATASPAAAAPPPGGTISVELHGAGEDYDPTAQTFVEAASAALAARGFTILDDPGHAAYVAELTYRREEVGTARAKAPAGGAAVVPGLSPGAGAGVVVPFSTGRSSLVPMQRTFLGFSMRPRGASQVVWHGAAVTVRSSGADKKTAADLSEAALRSYPAEAPDVVGVP